MMRELPFSWSDVDIDPTLRLLAERAARVAGIPVNAWIERAIRRACPEYFVPAIPIAPPSPAAYAEPPRPMAPPAPVAPMPVSSGAGAALAELIARARQPQAEARPAPAQYQFVPPPTASPIPVLHPAMAPPAGNIPLDGGEPPPGFEAAAPASRQYDEPIARHPSPLERARESKRRAAAFATEVSDWRGHDERSPRSGAPWPVFGDGTAEEPYVPLDAGAEFNTREPLELRDPIRARRSRRPLLIAVAIALAVALGALGAQRFVVGRLGRQAPIESAAIATPSVTPSETVTHRAALPPAVLLPAPAVPSAATLSAPPPAAPSTAANDTGALLPPSLVTPTNSPPPPPPVTASMPIMPATTPSQPTASIQSSASATSVPSQPVAATPEPEQSAATEAAHPDAPRPLPPRKVAAVKPTPKRPVQQAEAAATSAARQATDAEAPRDPAKLASWLEQRAKTGDAVAEYRLGVLYALGQGVKQDYAHAAELFKSAATGGVAEAQYNVAVMYSEGMGVQRDPVQAVSWYEKAAEQGNPNAAFNLGVAYSNGTGVRQDMPEAARWFRRAAAAGVINAQFNLGLLYERGEGVPQSLVEAYAWYAAAAARGDQGAEQRRDHIASALAPGDLKKAQTRATQLQQTIQASAAPSMSQKANASTP